MSGSARYCRGGPGGLSNRAHEARERGRECDIVLTDMCSVGVVQEQTRGPWDLENLE